MFEHRSKDSKDVSADTLTNMYGIDLYFGNATFSKSQCLVINKIPIPFKKCIIATGTLTKYDDSLKYTL